AARSAARVPLARGLAPAAASDLAAGSPGTEPSRQACPLKGVPFKGPAPPVRGPLDRQRVGHSLMRVRRWRKHLVRSCNSRRDSRLGGTALAMLIPSAPRFAHPAPPPRLARL